MKVFKRRAWFCPQCDRKAEALAWDDDPVPVCAEHRVPMREGDVRVEAVSVIDDQIEGGPRFFETLGHEPVWIESKSQLRREAEKRGLENIVRHDSAYYAKQRKMHDEYLRDTGQLVTQPRRY